MEAEKRPEFVIVQRAGKATVVRASSISAVRVDESIVVVTLAGGGGFNMDCEDHEEAIMFARHVAFAMGMSREDAEKIGEVTSG